MSDDKNIFITSHGQMGGITAQTINFGQKARSMNEKLSNQLKKQIPTSASVSVLSVLGDSEAFGFANQILTWMKENGYKKVEGVNQAVYIKPVVGQIINRKNDNEFDIIIGSRG